MKYMGSKARHAKELLPIILANRTEGQWYVEPFYEWCRQKHKEGHQVFVSEYNMPEDFICVWSKEVNNSLTKDTGSKKGIEKLFTLKETNDNN